MLMDFPMGAIQLPAGHRYTWRVSVDGEKREKIGKLSLLGSAAPAAAADLRDAHPRCSIRNRVGRVFWLPHGVDPATIWAEHWGLDTHTGRLQSTDNHHDVPQGFCPPSLGIGPPVKSASLWEECGGVALLRSRPLRRRRDPRHLAPEAVAPEPCFPRWEVEPGLRARIHSAGRSTRRQSFGHRREARTGLRK